MLGKIAEAVLGGLTYLYRAHRIMHRDIKPSNVLVNSRGQIKLCDFGVSSELDNSVADTFVGTGTYMAPERIQGSPYTVKSDVWSVGLTLMELAIGKFPFSSDSGSDDEPGGPQGILDLLQQIVLEPAPKLPKSDAFPSILEDVIAKCLMKVPEERPTPQELYVRIPSPPLTDISANIPSGIRPLPPSRKAHPRRSRSLGRKHDGAPQPEIAPSTATLAVDKNLPPNRRQRLSILTHPHLRRHPHHHLRERHLQRPQPASLLPRPHLQRRPRPKQQQHHPNHEPAHPPRPAALSRYNAPHSPSSRHRPAPEKRRTPPSGPPR